MRVEKHVYLCREKQIGRKRKGCIFDFLIVLGSTGQLEDTDLEPLHLLAGLGLRFGWGWRWWETAQILENSYRRAHDQGWETKINGYLLTKRTGIRGMFIVEGNYTRKVNSVGCVGILKGSISLSSFFLISFPINFFHCGIVTISTSPPLPPSHCLLSPIALWSP